MKTKLIEAPLREPESVGNPTRRALQQKLPFVTVASAEAFPGVQGPQVAVDDHQGAYVVFGAGNTIYCAASSDGGRTFAAPVRIAEAGKLSLGMRRGPRVAIARGAVVVTAVYGKSGVGQDGDLLAWRSGDKGRTWTGPITVNDVPGSGREGLHGMAAAPDGTLACAWLDLRQKGTQLYAAFSKDNGKTWGRNVLVYQSPAGTICECCHPSLAYDRRGTLYAFWRNWLGGNRDMYLAKSVNGGATFGAAEKLGTGSWPLNACPMDGGMIAPLAGGGVATVWRRERAIYACMPGKPERRLGPGQQPWATATAEGPAYIWLQGRPGVVMVLTPGQGSPLPLAPSGNDPVITTRPDGKGPFVAAWTGETGIEAMIFPYRQE